MKLSTVAICLAAVTLACHPNAVQADDGTGGILSFFLGAINFVLSLFNVLPSWVDGACSLFDEALGGCECKVTPNFLSLGVTISATCSAVSGCFDSAGTICADCKTTLSGDTTLVNGTKLEPSISSTLSTECTIDSEKFTGLQIKTNGGLTAGSATGFEASGCSVQTLTNGVASKNCTCTTEGCSPLEVSFTCDVLGNTIGSDGCTRIGSLF